MIDGLGPWLQLTRQLFEPGARESPETLEVYTSLSEELPIIAKVANVVAADQDSLQRTRSIAGRPQDPHLDNHQEAQGETFFDRQRLEGLRL